jgi:hypothetical protein
MGSDIHICVEKKKWGKWITADTWYENSSDPEHSYQEIHQPVYSGRDYVLFAVLAGVRAWLKTDQKFPTKGFPKDASSETKKYYKQYEGDAHSTSYLTLQELESINWEKEYIPVYSISPKRS